MNCFQAILELHKLCCFQSIEGDRVGPASNSEIRRWFKQGIIEINSTIATAEGKWPSTVESLVLFPNNKRKRCTLI